MRIQFKKAFLISIIFIFISCGSNNEQKVLKINLEEKSDSGASGKITFVEKNGIVSLTAHVYNLSPGEHAIHIHEKSDCSSDDGKSSGGHWNPTFKNHGKWGDIEGYHKGDIGNFTADKIGHASINFETNQWCLDCNDETKNIIGKAIIIHQGSDDFISQPSGAAGSRIICGAIIEN
tara:strand:- start:179 stop:709 length:531 start_codon:yes stop_codon:yes gene_type:complete